MRFLGEYATPVGLLWIKKPLCINGMFHILNNRLGHYLLLLATASTLFLPGLGASTLWDIDEGNNAECAREMFDADNWIVPTFNYKLRTDKPAMLYWLQMLAYRQFGVNEFGARTDAIEQHFLSYVDTFRAPDTHSAFSQP